MRTFSERKVKKPMVYREGSRWKWEYSVAYLGCTEHHTSRKTFPSKAAAKEDLRVDMCFEWLDDS